MRSGLRRLFRSAGPGQPEEEAARPDETTPADGADQQPDSVMPKPPWELDGPSSDPDRWQGSAGWTPGSQSGGAESGSADVGEGALAGDWELTWPDSGEDGRPHDEEVAGSPGDQAEAADGSSVADAAAGAGVENAVGTDADSGAVEADVGGVAAGADAKSDAANADSEDVAAEAGAAGAVTAEASAEDGAAPAGAQRRRRWLGSSRLARRRWLGSSRLARHARVARISAAVVRARVVRVSAAVSRVQARASGRAFARLTLLPALLVIAWLLPAMPLLLGGSFALAPMLVISIPVALALIYFGLRQVPGRWPESAQAKPGPGDRAPFWATFATFAVAAGFTAWQMVMASHQVAVTRDPGVYLNFGYWIAHHGSVTIPVSATAFGAHHSGLAFASAGFLYNGVNLIPQFLAGLPALLAAGFWTGGTSAAVLVPPVIGGLAVLAFGGLTGRLAGPRWAPAGAIVLALALPEQYTSRTAFSETLTQVLLFGGLCLLIDSLCGPAERTAAARASADPALAGSVVAGADPGAFITADADVTGDGSAAADPASSAAPGDSGVAGADSGAFITADADVTGDGSAAADPASSPAGLDPGSGDPGDPGSAFASAGSGPAAADPDGASADSADPGPAGFASSGFGSGVYGSVGSGLAGPGSAGFGSADPGPAEFGHDPADPDTEDLPVVGAEGADPAGPSPAAPATTVLPAVAARMMHWRPGWRRPSWLAAPSQAAILALLAGLALGLTAAIRVDGLSILLPAIPIVGIMFSGRRPQWLPFGLGLIIGAGYGLADDLLLARPYFDSLSSWTRPFGITIAAVAVITLDCALIWRYARLGRLAKRVLAVAPLRWLPGVIATLTVLVMVAFAVRPYIQTVRGDTNTGEISYVGYLQRVAGLPLDAKRLYSEDTLYWVIWYIGLPAVLLGVFGFALLTQRVLRSFFTWKDPIGAARLWALPLLIIGWITVTVLWRPGTVPDQPWASRRLVPVVLPGLVLVAVWAAAWLTGRARARGAGKAASSAVALFCLGALLLPTTLTTFGIGVASSSIGKGTSKRLALQPVGLGQLDAVHSVCTTLGPDAAVVIVDPRVASQFTQVIRGMCNVPVAAMDRPAPVSLQPVISGIVSAHRHPVILGANAAELNLFGTPPRRILNLTTTQDAHELTRPPTTTWPIHYTIWMSQVG